MSAAASPITYRVTRIHKAKWTGSVCWGLNAGGYSVGDAALSRVPYDQVGWLAAPGGRARTTGTRPSDDATGAYAVNAWRMVVGMRITDKTFGFREPAAWDAEGNPLPLAVFGDGNGSAQALNDGGDVVGTVSAENGDPHAVLWANGRAIDLSPAHLSAEAVVINARRQIAMTADGLAYRIDKGEETPLGALGGQYSSAAAINAAGHVAGSATLVGDGVSHAFLWKDGVMLDLGAPEGGQSVAWALNAHDVVVGHLAPPGAPHRAAVWRDGRMHVLDDLLDPVTGAGWQFDYASAINDAGQICASGNLGSALLTPVR